MRISGLPLFDGTDGRICAQMKSTIVVLTGGYDLCPALQRIYPSTVSIDYLCLPVMGTTLVLSRLANVAYPPEQP